MRAKVVRGQTSSWTFPLGEGQQHFQRVRNIFVKQHKPFFLFSIEIPPFLPVKKPSSDFHPRRTVHGKCQREPCKTRAAIVGTRDTNWKDLCVFTLRVQRVVPSTPRFHTPSDIIWIKWWVPTQACLCAQEPRQRSSSTLVSELKPPWKTRTLDNKRNHQFPQTSEPVIIWSE